MPVQLFIYFQEFICGLKQLIVRCLGYATWAFGDMRISRIIGTKPGFIFRRSREYASKSFSAEKSLATTKGR